MKTKALVLAIALIAASISHATSLPNLTPYQPSGWSDKIVVTRTSGSTTDSTSLTTADSLYMDWAVINNGATATTNGFYTDLYIDGVHTARFNTPGTLSVGSYASVTAYPIGSFSAGTHTIEIIADSTGLVAESNESDNSYTKTITVGNPPLPNLTPYQPSGWSDKIVVTRTSGSTTDSTGLTTADTLYMDWAVINNGAAATTSGFYTALYIDGVKTATFNTAGTLTVGSYASVTGYSLGSFSAGTHTIEIVADSTGLIAESNESDNSYTKTITVGTPPLPNLTPYQPSGWSDKIVVTRTSSSTTDSTSLTTADTLYMDWAVINNGTATTTSGFYTALYIDGVKTATFNTAGTLGVNADATVTGYPLGSFTAGTHTIEITVDSTGLIAESNESDNSYTKTITVGNPTTFILSDMATLNGTQENSITLVTSANLSGSFPYLATESGSGGQNMITVVGLVNNSGQWVGGTPRVVYNGIPASGGSSGTASWSNMTVPSSSGTCQLWFQSYLTTSTSSAINSFEASPPTSSGLLSGIVATVIVGNLPSFISTAMATLNGTQENSITLAPSAYLSGSFPYLAADGGSPGQNMITVMGLVNNAGQWVGGTPQIVYNGIPSQAGSSGTANWSNLTVPSSTGTYQLWFQSFLTTSASVIYSFEATPPTASGGLAGIAATVVVGNPSSFTGGLAGRVLGNGSPLGNAQVRLENTAFNTNTMSDGTFSFSNIPSGNGYVLDVSAAGYNSARLTGMNVPIVNINNVGDIPLTSIGGPYTLKEMPNVNPAITTVEQGGTAYRYYCVLNASGNPQGGIPVSAQILNGAAIPQNDTSSFWPGSVAGVSDGNAYGTVRIAVPSSYLNSDGSVQTIQLSIGGQVQKTFQAQVAPRQYEQIWKQKLGSGISVGELITAGLDTSAESDLCHKIVGGSVSDESISRIKTVDATVGAGVDVGSSLSVSTPNLNISAGNEVSAGANAFAAVNLRSTFSFDPNTTDPGQNAMKLYVDLGNVLSGAPGPQAAFYDFVESTIEPLFLNSNLRSVEGDVQVGGGYSGQVSFNIIDAGPAQVDFNASADASMEFIFGHEATFGSVSESAGVSGITASGSAMIGVIPSLNFGDTVNLTLNNNLQWQTSYDVELLSRNWTKQGQSSPYRAESVRKLGLGVNQQNPVPAWQQYDPQNLYANYDRDFIETLEQTNGVNTTSYRWSVYAQEQELGVNLNLDLGLGVTLQGELDRGAEVVNQRGAISQSRYWPTETYPPMTADMLPTQSWPSILSQWGNYALGPIGQAINQAITTIANAGNTVVQAGQATLNVAEGALNSGAQVISSWASDLSHISLAIPAGKPVPLGGPVPNGATYLPPDGSSNYIYGIDGVYRFTSTNAFSGTATLAIPYNPADVTGLDPTQLQIYQLPDGTNRWQLIGGVVDTVSNTVTATITNLGTFAIAPPLPTGNLQLIPSTNALSADGVSTMTVVVTNLMLNNGNAATQQWFFTASATGVQILNPDCDTNFAGIQVVSTNGSVTLLLQAPSGGNTAQIYLASVAGDAAGSVTISLIDTTPPATPTNVVVTPGQSRIWVSWQTNSEPDLAGYRVYYSAGVAGPPWNGTAAIEGSPSPVSITGTNWLLRGLMLGTNYFVAVSAVDTSSNESPLSAPIEVTTVQTPPMPPTGVTARFDGDSTNVLVWALSEDDGYNDRDVTNYYIWRAILPGGSYTNIAQVPAGVGIYTEPNPTIASTQSVSYAVSAVTGSGSNSTQVVASIVPPSNVVSSNAIIVTPHVLSNGNFQFGLQGLEGQTYVVQTSTNLVNWTSVYTNNGSFIFTDLSTTNYGQRFYRVMAQ